MPEAPFAERECKSILIMIRRSLSSNLRSATCETPGFIYLRVKGHLNYLRTVLKCRREFKSSSKKRHCTIQLLEEIL